MMLPPDILKEIKRIQLKAGHLVTDALAGEYLSAFKGVGQEFEKVREYTPGDDVRTIDWNVTARMNAPFVKVFQEERELTMMIMVDVSPSQNFGTGGRFKKELAAELAAVLAFLAIKNHDKVGLVVFSDHVEHFIPPQKGRAHVWRIIRSVLTHEGSGRSTDLAGALNFLVQVCRRKAMCFLVSDFCASGYERALKIAAKRHEIVAAIVRDEREQLWAGGGLLELMDAESGERRIVDLSDRHVQASFRQIRADEEAALHNSLRRQGIDFFALDTAVPSLVDPLARYLKQRERRLLR